VQLRAASNDPNRFPLWIRYAKKVLLEEGQSLPHLIHIWQLIVRHAELFYSSRAQFVPQMVTGLTRLGLPTNSVLENRRLSIDLAAMMMAWERQRLSGPPHEKEVRAVQSFKTGNARCGSFGPGAVVGFGGPLAVLSGL
jgi:transformation/transcription domain-associated protein